jgi:hypothetical protein
VKPPCVFQALDEAALRVDSPARQKFKVAVQNFISACDTRLIPARSEHLTGSPDAASVNAGIEEPLKSRTREPQLNSDNNSPTSQQWRAHEKRRT